MAFRPRPRLRALRTSTILSSPNPLPQRCKFASAAVVATATSSKDVYDPVVPIQRYPPKQPPSWKSPDLRKSQLLRQYTSLLRSSPLTIYFQHNSLKASEWIAIRRVLSVALHKVSSSSTTPRTRISADSIRLQIVRTSMYAVALRIVEFYNPTTEQEHNPTAPIHASAQASTIPTHDLSRAAYEATLMPSTLKRRQKSKGKYDKSAASHRKRNTPLHGLLRGPIATLYFPTVTPEHLAAALSILAPTPGANSAFPAPKRKATPGYYDSLVQSGLQKLLLLGARVDGRAMDGEGVRWVGGLARAGGLEGLRAQLVQMLQGVGANITGTLESASKSLWLTMEGRRVSLEDGEKGGDKAEAS